MGGWQPNRRAGLPAPCACTGAPPAATWPAAGSPSSGSRSRASRERHAPSSGGEKVNSTHSAAAATIGAHDQDDEDRRAVTWIEHRIVEPAGANIWAGASDSPKTAGPCRSADSGRTAPHGTCSAARLIHPNPSYLRRRSPRPTHRCRRTGTARRRRRSASTRPPPRSRNDAPA